MLVTKSVFKFIFVLSNYQTCTFPLIPEESCRALPRKNSRPAVTIASLDWGTDWNEILMTLSCRAQSQVPVTKRIILEGHWLPKVDHRCKGSGSQSVFKTALAKLDDQKKKVVWKVRYWWIAPAAPFELVTTICDWYPAHFCLDRRQFLTKMFCFKEAQLLCI